MARSTSQVRAAVERCLTEILREIASDKIAAGLRVTVEAAGLSAQVIIWPAVKKMPTLKAAQEKSGGLMLAECKAACERLVRDAGEPIRRVQIVKLLKGKYGAGTVAKSLGHLTRERRIINPRDKRGYRHPKWSQLTLFD